MATSEELDDAWKRGFLAGVRQFRLTVPTIPPRPGTIPSGVGDPIKYFYDEGRRAALLLDVW